ncbi:MAG: acyl-CoA dehydrogenase family protein, partial [Acidobacteria bacterium]|nr:acyl-CoA dehydrogenase family protein [Acidobacteriota bacterium]
MAAELEKELIKGGGFLLTETLPAQVFSPEDFSDEQKMIGETTSEFVDREVVPRHDEIETKDYELQR